MRNVGKGRVTGLFRGIHVLAALAAAVPAFAASSCANVTVEQEGTPPTLLAIEPSEGPSKGGSLVVITGKDFREDAVVRFGGELATDVKWIDEQTLNVVTPPGAGVVSVSVENPNHMVDTLEAAFTYTGAASGCAVLKTLPIIGADSVPIVGELRLTYSTPLDAASVAGTVTLRLLGTDQEVPADVALDPASPTDVVVKPSRSLHFWGKYVLAADGGVLAADGGACAPAALAFTTYAPHPLLRKLRPAPITGLTLAGDHIIAASEGYRGLQIYDVGGAAPNLASDLETSYGPRGVVVKGTRAYVPSGTAGVRIFDVVDPAAPKELGYAATPGSAVDVAVVEKNGKTFVIVADMSGGARVLDATDPLAVIEIGKLKLPAGAADVFALDAQGDRIVVAEANNITILDLPEPSSLSSQITHFTFNVNGGLTDVLLDGDRLFAGQGAFGVSGFNIKNPASPAFINQAQDPDGPCPSACKHIASRLVKEGDELFVAYARGGVVAYPIDAAGALTFGTNYKVPGDVRTLAVTPTLVYAGGEEGLVVFNRAGNGAEPMWFDPNGHGRARTVRVREGFAYVGAYLRGVQTFSLADPELPELVDRDDTPASLTEDEAAFGVSTDDGVLAVGDGRAGVTLFDLGDPKNPVLGGTIDTSDAVRSILSVGNIVYACNDNNGLVVVDANDPKSPKLLAEVKFTDVAGSDACRDFAAGDGVMYVARSAGLGVLDIASPNDPAWKGLITLPSKAPIAGVRRLGSHLVATSTRFDYEGVENNSSRLHIFDIADPFTPKLVWTSAELGRASSLAIVGDIAFLSGGNLGIHVFDIADITAPVFEGTIPTPGNVAFLAPGASVLYAAQGAGGLQAIATGPLPQQ